VLFSPVKKPGLFLVLQAGSIMVRITLNGFARFFLSFLSDRVNHYSKGAKGMPIDLGFSI
jgi:hypothetical protein